jgi:hypothetical protein
LKYPQSVEHSHFTLFCSHVLQLDGHGSSTHSAQRGHESGAAAAAITGGGDKDASSSSLS